MKFQIGWGVFWVMMGVIASILYVGSIRLNALALDPTQKGKGLFWLILSNFARFVMMGLIIYLAIRNSPMYAILFVIAFSLSQFAVIPAMTKWKQSQSKGEEN